MNDKFACNQVISLLSFYIDGKTNYQITNFVQSHLCKCKSCRDKYILMAKIFNDLYTEKAEKVDNLKPADSIPMYSYSESFKEKMSAYLDSELSDDEILRFKKYAIANPPVRNELECMYKVKNAINNSFKKTKTNFKSDLSKNIIVKLDIKKSISIQQSILKAASVIIFLLVFMSVWFILVF